MPCFKPTTNPQLDAERTALGKISPQVDAEKVLNASPFTPQSSTSLASRLGWQESDSKAKAQAGLQFMVGVRKAVRIAHGFR